MAVAEVADIADAFQFPFLYQGVLALLHFGLVDLVRYLGDDDTLPSVDFFEGGFGAHHHPAATGFIGAAHAFQSVDDPTGRKIGGLDEFHEFLGGDIVVVDVGDDALTDLVEVVRGHVGGHTDGNTRNPVNKQVGHFGRHYLGFFQRVVEIGLEIHGFLVEVFQQLFGQLSEPGFGVAHGGRIVAVHRSEIALTVYQRIAQAPFLGHAHHSVIDGRIAVGVKFSQHLPYNTG